MSFNSDLQHGEKGEQLILEILKRKYPLAHKMDYKFHNFDLYVPEKDISIEVKWDRQAWKTGNLIIEFECNGQPSGYKTSCADWWYFIYDVDYDTYFSAIDKIDLHFCIDKYGKIWHGGYGDTSKFYYVPLRDFERHDFWKPKLLFKGNEAS